MIGNLVCLCCGTALPEDALRKTLRDSRTGLSGARRVVERTKCGIANKWFGTWSPDRIFHHISFFLVVGPFLSRILGVPGFAVITVSKFATRVS